MAKKKAGLENTITYDEPIVRLRPTVMENPVIPTRNARHITGIREGKISGEIWSRSNREKIMVDPDVSEALLEEDNIRKMKQKADKKQRAAR